jgi:hypothetical protein
VVPLVGVRRIDRGDGEFSGLSGRLVVLVRHPTHRRRRRNPVQEQGEDQQQMEGEAAHKLKETAPAHRKFQPAENGPARLLHVP